MLGRPSFRRGLRDGLVVFVAVGAFGVAYGVLGVQAGLAPWLVVLASAVVVSGAAQFAWVSLADAGAAPVLVAVTGLALRHIPMSARVAGLVGPRPRRVRFALAWVLVDETFGLTVAAARRGEPDLVAYKTAVDLLLFSGWVAGTVAGAALGGRFDPGAWGADVFFAVLFVGLAAPLVRTRWDLLVVALAVGATFGAVVLPSAWRITAAAAAAAAVGAVLPGE
ncbi:MAG TPA: AzlC family ABC transporter permease [Acidimicrobiia bacterium]|nr:AzlC family ABC transporter permease [Acidimicrobiia bacterium]